MRSIYLTLFAVDYKSDEIIYFLYDTSHPKVNDVREESSVGAMGLSVWQAGDALNGPNSHYNAFFDTRCAAD